MSSRPKSHQKPVLTGSTRVQSTSKPSRIQALNPSNRPTKDGKSKPSSNLRRPINQQGSTTSESSSSYRIVFSGVNKRSDKSSTEGDNDASSHPTESMFSFGRMKKTTYDLSNKFQGLKLQGSKPSKNKNKRRVKENDQEDEEYNYAEGCDESVQDRNELESEEDGRRQRDDTYEIEENNNGEELDEYEREESNEVEEEDEYYVESNEVEEEDEYYVEESNEVEEEDEYDVEESNEVEEEVECRDEEFDEGENE